MAFNDAQKTAIRHREGPMLVLAGPGSGKTTVTVSYTHLIDEVTKDLHHEETQDEEGAKEEL